MNGLILAYYIILLILSVLFLIYMIHGLAVSQKGLYPPYVPLTGKGKKIIIGEVSKILKKSSGPLTIFDPGCGSGTLIVPLAKKFPQHKFVGIEWSYPYYFAKFFARGLRNVELVHGDMFKHSFGEADVIVCFLVKKLMPMVSDKIIKETKKGCVVFSVFEEIPNLVLKEKIEYKHYGYLRSGINVYQVK